MADKEKISNASRAKPNQKTRTDTDRNMVDALEDHISLSEANKLWNKYYHDQTALENRERKLLAANVHQLNLEKGDLDMFGILMSEHDFSSKEKIYAKHNIHSNNETVKSKIDLFFQKTERILQKFIKLGSQSPDKMPEQPYDGSRVAGFATVAIDDDFTERRQIGAGDILDKVDNGFVTSQGTALTKAIKYQRYSLMKVLSIVAANYKKPTTDNSVQYSEDTKFGIKGAVEIEYEGRYMVLGYSGGTQFQDQAIIILAAYEAGMIDDEEVKERQKTLQNPYLTPQFLKNLREVE
ncbi:MAG: hypothetical protein WC875_00075 [Candidatus Absconditabacterales bacterium]